MVMVQENTEKLLESLYDIKKHLCKLIDVIEEHDEEQYNERRGRRGYRRHNERYNDRYDY